MENEKRSPEHCSLQLQKPKHSIHKPCLAQQKECEYGSVPDAVEGKIRKEKRKVIVRSSYFQHKPENENDQENKQNVLVKDDLGIDTHKDIVAESAVINAHSNCNVLKRKKHTDDSVQEVSTLFYVLFFMFK